MSRFVPALRFRALTRFFDLVLAVAIPEKSLKRRLVEQVALAPGQAVLDVGSGTGTLAILLKQAQPLARVVGLDGDPEVNELARQKIAAASLEVELRQGLAFELPFDAGTFDHVVSSLVFHHLSPADKRRTFADIRRVLKPGGVLHVLDWGEPHDPLMRFVFLGTQFLDGFENTSENVRGELPRLMTEAGFVAVEERLKRRSLAGSLSLYCAVRGS